jgi:MFS family permease
MAEPITPRHLRPVGPKYKWIALSNTTLGVLMSAMNGSILLISLPAIFRGLKIDPLAPAESGYLLWMLLGYMVVTATMLVTLGRLSDIFGRVRLYNLGFLVFTVASILLFLTPFSGNTGALFIIIVRLVQGIGGGLLTANSSAILTDAFPPNERGFALGMNMVAALAGSLAGLLIGGALATVNWRVVFLVSVPFGIIGTIWAFMMLREQSTRRTSRGMDVIGNLCLAGGLVALLAALTYGIMPYGGSNMGWANPWVIAGLIFGPLLLVAFVFVERRVAQPLFHLDLFKIRGFAIGNIAQLLFALAYGGLQFMIIIWLQGVWLPLHGYDFEDTPLWSAIYMIPMLAGFTICGLIGGWLADRISIRALTTGSMAALAVGFLLLMLFPANFRYLPFAIVLFIIGCAFGLFSAPNTTAVMNALPPEYRGVGSGMRSTFQAAGSPLSLSIFFGILVLVLSQQLPGVMQRDLVKHDVPQATAAETSNLPPTGALFAAFLGINPMESILPKQTVDALPQADRETVLGKQFFPDLISEPLVKALRAVFAVSAVLALLAAIASFFRGGRFVYEEASKSPPRTSAAMPAD